MYVGCVRNYIIVIQDVVVITEEMCQNLKEDLILLCALRILATKIVTVNIRAQA